MYYYHSRTRESAWTKPENVKIITQEEVETMAAQNPQGGGANRNASGTTTAAQAAVAQGEDIVSFFVQWQPPPPFKTSLLFILGFPRLTLSLPAIQAWHFSR